VFFGVLGILLYLFAPIYPATLSNGQVIHISLLIDPNGHLILPDTALAIITLLIIIFFAGLGVGVIYRQYLLEARWKYEILIISLLLVVTLLTVNLELLRLFLIPGVVLALITTFLAFTVSPTRNQRQ